MKQTYSLIVLCLMALFSYAQELDVRNNGAFQDGEQLKYKLKYGFITAAEGTLKVEPTDVKFENKPTFHLIAEGRTSGTFDIFYKVRDRYDSYIDKTTLLPYQYYEDIHESNYKRSDNVRFYQGEQKIVGTKGTFKGVLQTFDLISCYYFARSLDLSKVSVGDKLKLNFFLKDEVSPFEIQYVGKERIKTSLGYFNCLKFSPALQPGRIFRKDSKLYLWITDDGNRIPVKAQVEILIGSVTLEITSAQGLKYPSSAEKK